MARRDPPSGRFTRDEKSRAEARAREQAEMDRTDDERTPVEHLIDRVATVEAVVVDHGATLAERYEMPHAEAWQRLEARIAEARAIADAAAARVKICDHDRERRGRWMSILKWAKGLAAGGVVGALVWAVTMIGDAGAAREAAARDKAEARRVFDDVRNLREQFAADHALLQLLVSRFAPP
jgi:hypothetical protein